MDKIPWALPLAVFTAVFIWGGPPLATATPEFGPSAQSQSLATVNATFAKCGFGARTNCVVDGDTLWHAGTKIRLADINTPETSSSDCAYEKQLGERATRRLIVLLNEAPFTLDRDPADTGRDEDRYGRKLRIARRDGRSLGTALVDEGLAEPWTGSRRNWC